MKIGIIAHNAHPISQPYQGGLEMLTFLLVEELVQRGHHVTTLCLKESTLSGDLVFYKELADVKGSAFEQFSTFHLSIKTFLTRDFDIIHNHSLSHHAIILGEHLNSPFITSFHTPVFDNIGVAIRSIGPDTRQYFTAVSSSLAELYEKNLNSVETIYNGINLETWTVSEHKRNYLSWCGRICKEKGLKETMDLCYRNNITLKFAGPISNQDYFRDEIEPRLKIYKCCQYVGHLKQKDINLMLSESKAFVFSSTWEEPYGLVIAEALATGTPVIANDIGAASEIITEDCGILFSLENPESFKIALSKLETISSIDCRKRAVQFCSHNIMVDNYEALYKKIVSKNQISYDSILCT